MDLTLFGQQHEWVYGSTGSPSRAVVRQAHHPEQWFDRLTILSKVEGSRGNATAIGEDRATRRSDPGALMVAYSPCFCRDKLRAVSSTVPPTYDIMLVPKKR
ncbi:MAG: hypothetical protein ABIL62_08370 [Planctomycetota bacterium]